MVAESGAIVEYLIRTYGKGRMAPDPKSEDFVRYLHWMHFAEGSAMLPLILSLYAGRIGEAAAPLQPRIDAELANHFGYMEAALEGKDYFIGPELDAADIQLGMVVHFADARGLLKEYPRLRAFLDRVRKRPAYQRALDRGGPLSTPTR